MKSKSTNLPRLLTIAGSDSSGGAGIQADIKTATALGAYAMTAITAVTAQDTTGVHAVQLIPSELVRAQIMACLRNIGTDVIKIGMLGSAEIAACVAATLRECANGIPIVLDPVLVSTSGTVLLERDGLAVLREQLIRLSSLVMPNLPEAAVLAGFDCKLPSDVLRAGAALLELGAGAALIKGGHGEGEILVDMLVTPQGHELFETTRIETRDTHGTGCTYASAVAVGLARGLPLSEAVALAHAYVQAAIATAPGFGRGHGPLNHMHAIER